MTGARVVDTVAVHLPAGLHADLLQAADAIGVSVAGLLRLCATACVRRPTAGLVDEAADGLARDFPTTLRGQHYPDEPPGFGEKRQRLAGSVLRTLLPGRALVDAPLPERVADGTADWVVRVDGEVVSGVSVARDAAGVPEVWVGHDRFAPALARARAAAELAAAAFADQLAVTETAKDGA